MIRRLLKTTFEEPEESRRRFLTRCSMGMGSLALWNVLGPKAMVPGLALEGAPGTPPAPSASHSPLHPGAPHFRPRARRIVHVFLNGGPSHVDTFDEKPLLAQYAGRTVEEHMLPTERRTGTALPSAFTFRHRGQSGLRISDAFEKTARHADDLCIVHSMHALVPNHEPSLMLMNCGSGVEARPSVGSWVLYGLGTENQNLPGFVALCPSGYPVKEIDNWRCGFLPGVFQGTFIDPQHRRVDRMIENIRSGHADLSTQARQIELLQALEREHARERAADSRLDARIHSFELAFRMQLAASDAFDLSSEPESIRAQYGDHVHGRQTLIARRLLERGVRFVQIWHGAGQPWDHHDQIEANLKTHAGEVDQPLAALITDLKQRGMFDDTLILIGGEFGRTPTVELNESGASKLGRDHNHYGFSVVLAGGGIRGGMTYGATDELGFKAVEDKVSVHDLHATLLHCLGLDHERLTFRHAGRDFRLTDVEGTVLTQILA